MNSEDKDKEIYDLKYRKVYAKELLEKFMQSNGTDTESFNKIVLLDNTLPEIYTTELKKHPDDIKLKERSHDIVDKDLLKKYNVGKKINYREIYFEIIDYISSIKVDEPKNGMERCESEDFISSNDESENNQSSIINESEENEISGSLDKESNDNDKIKVNIKEKNDLDENLSDSEFQKVLENMVNFDLKKLLIKNEKINVDNIKLKLSRIYETYCGFINYKNNYPDFESELFYFNCLRYMLDTYKTLLYRRFLKKIELNVLMDSLTEEIKKDKLGEKTKIFYYYIMNTQYCFDTKILDSISFEDNENKEFLHNDYMIKNNNLYKKNNENEVLLENVDNYLINILLKKKRNIPKLGGDILQEYYSFKGYLKNLSFQKEDGDRFWEEFLSSNVLDDLVKYLYKKDNIFKQRAVKDIFKERSYYFHNFNTNLMAVSHKELFYMFFSPSKVQPPYNISISSYILDMIDKAINKVKIQHEWGHTSSSFLFFTLKTKYFTTPQRNIKFLEKSDSENDEKKIKEGGQSVEILLYGRVINELTAKEAIFILNSDNYKLSLNDFHDNFVNLDKKL